MTEPLCIKIDGAWTALPLRSTEEMVVNRDGIALSYEALDGLPASEQADFGAFRPDPLPDPPKGKILADRTLGGDDRPVWHVTYQDALPPLPHVPPTVFDYQFAGEAEVRGFITVEECDAWVGPGVIPPTLLEKVERLITDPEAQRRVVLFLKGSKEFPRFHDNTIALGALFGLDTSDALDAFFIAAKQR